MNDHTKAVVDNTTTAFFFRKCPCCNEDIKHTTKRGMLRASKNLCKSCCKIGNKNPFYNKSHSDISIALISNAAIGRPSPFEGRNHSDETKLKSGLAIKRYYSYKINRDAHSKRMTYKLSNPNVREKLSDARTKCWNDPIIREKYISSMKKSNWLKVRCDIGQLEFLEKWNRLGFNFQANYMLTDGNGFLAYLDGYDVENNVVVEYDGKSHVPAKDLPRQTRIIELLNPRKFWRYNKKTNTIFNVL